MTHMTRAITVSVAALILFPTKSFAKKIENYIKGETH